MEIYIYKYIRGNSYILVILLTYHNVILIFILNDLQAQEGGGRGLGLASNGPGLEFQWFGTPWTATGGPARTVDTPYIRPLIITSLTFVMERIFARILPPQLSTAPANLSLASGLGSTSNSERSRT